MKSKKIFKWAKDLFCPYKPDCEYWVYLKDIKVPVKYKCTKVKKNKWIRKLNYWRDTGEFESPIIIDRDFNLIDGYSSVKIAYVNEIEKVPVCFK